MLWEKPLLCGDTMGEDLEKDDGSIIVVVTPFDSDP